MKRYLAVLLGSALLYACGSGSNPFTTDADDGNGTGGNNPSVTNDIPTALAGDVTRVTYDPAAMTLTVEGLTLDDIPFSATYARRPGKDVAGYEAYTTQNDGLDRHSTAYVAQSNNAGAVRASVVSTGGPRNRVFAGGFYERDGGYTPPAVSPTSGLVSYAGSYVGLTNVDGDGSDLIPVAPGTPPELIPSEAAEITGDAFLQADFADNSVEGNITNRVLVDRGTPLGSIVLVQTGIEADGTFSGTQVEYDLLAYPGENVVGTDIGDYGGIFGGPDASGVAGIVQLDQFDGPNDEELGFEAETEVGIFVLDQCGQPVDASICANVNP